MAFNVFAVRLRPSCATALLAASVLLPACGSGVKEGTEGWPDHVKALAERTPVRMSESNYRQEILEHRMPAYPPTSLERGTEGVAVASIIAGLDGRVESVELLQAPDEETGRAVQQALEHWVFHPVRANNTEDGAWASRRVESRMTFYFRIVDGVGFVQNPADAREGLAAGAATETREGADALGAVMDLRGVDLDTVLRGRATFVDIRDREEYRSGNRRDSVNIPMSEIETRAPRELDPQRFIVILCPEATPGALRFCKGMAAIVANAGFERVGVLPDVDE